MSGQIILQIILFGLALSMDAFAVSITDGLIYKNINKKKSVFIALVFAIFQGLMPLIGYWFIELINVSVGAQQGKETGDILSLTVCWIAFALLLIIGAKMIYSSIKEIKKSQIEKTTKLFSYKEVLLFGIITSIDALAVGVSLHGGTLSDNTTIWLHIVIISVITFLISLAGVFLGNFFNKLFRGKYEASSIIGGSILIILAIWIVISHYMGF